MSLFLNRKHKSSLFQERISLFDKYGIELAFSLSKLTDIEEQKIKKKIETLLEKKKEEVKANVEESLSTGDVVSSKIESDTSSEGEE
jgi:DNA topoisomerase VI subunit B